jgi:diguanylate cyclase (GGDEF)-like protein/PAS domain S-box-containing protein
LKNFFISVRTSGWVSIVSIASLIYLIVLASTVADFYADIPQWVLIVQAIGACVIAVNFVVYIKLSNVNQAASVLLFCIFCIHMANVNFAGSIDTPHYAWILLIPILAGATLGWKGQTAFGLLTIAGTVYYAIYPVALDGTPYDGNTEYLLLTRVLSLVVFIAIMLSYHFVLNEKIEQLKVTLKKASFESDLFTGVFNTQSQSVFLCDEVGKIIRANKKGHETFGYSQGELIGRLLSDLCTPNIHLLLKGNKHNASEGRELKITTHNGNTLWIELSSIDVSDQFNTHYRLLSLDDITGRKNHESQLSYLAHYDYLTKLPNRLFVQDRLGEMISGGQRYQREFAVVFVDLDKFKHINDMKGHEAGDAVLVEVGERLKSMIRRCDIVARFGGDEFVLLLNEVSQPEDFINLLDKLKYAINQPVVVNTQEYFVGASFGISMYPKDGDTPSDLLRKADTAMFKAKKAMKGSYEFYSEHHDDSVKRLIKLGSELNYAIEREELTLLYQPIYNQKDEITGVEALIRWQHGELGSISPDEFIPISEDNGLIVPIGLWVLDSACKMLNRIHGLGYENITMSVNISYRQINSGDLVHEVKSLLSDYEIDGKYLGLELTERVFADDLSLVQSNIEQFSTLGVETAIDDFGVGYSSLSYLKKTDFSTLKIDRSFIRDIEKSSSARKLCEAIVAMAKSLGLKTTAEGIEKPQHLRMLKSMDVDRYQGFYMSKPLKADEFEALLSAKPASEETTE